MQIPIINVAAKAQEKHPQLDHALSEVGFMMIKNSGIDPDLLDQVYTASHAFFTGDSSVKEACRYRNAQENFGYQGMVEENLDPDAPADLKETFTMRNILGRPMPTDRWPSPEFRDLMSTFFDAVFSAGLRLQQDLESILQVPPGFFQNCHSGENVTLRLLYYPSIQDNSVETQQMGAGAHTDYGLLTLLFQDDVGGLQVMDQEQNWVDATPVPNAIVINCGDLLERWTNGRYRSTVHRVQPNANHRARLSIAMFIDPDSNTMVETLPACIDADHPNQFPPISAGDHLLEKISATHKDRFN